MISIVIPLYNKQAYIQHTIESALSQDNADFEIVVVDDGSTDESALRVSEMKSEKIRLLYKQNGGSASARNLGILNAHGDWIMILDADDTLEPGILSHFESLIHKEPKCEFFVCNHYLVKGGEKRLYSKNYKEGYLVNNFYAWCIGTFMPVAGSCIIKKERLLNHLFKEALRRYEDAESLFEIMREVKVYESPLPAMSYNLDSTCASHARKDISEDFIGHLSMKGKGWWEQYAIYQLYLQGCQLYPEDMKRLYKEQDFHNWRIRIIERFFLMQSKLSRYSSALRRFFFEKLLFINYR